MKGKSEVGRILEIFQNMVVKTVDGREYYNIALYSYFELFTKVHAWTLPKRMD